MFFVDLRLPPHDLAAKMGDMRIWLDKHHIETSGFFVKEETGCTMARLAFGGRREAEHFASRFTGRMNSDRQSTQADYSATAGPRYPLSRSDTAILDDSARLA
jgi:hypothetical protein